MRTGSKLRAAAVGLPLWVATSCISFNYVSFSTGEPTDEAALADLQPGEVSLSECLTRLGAPELVWPSETGNVNLAYAWIDVSDWGVSVSYAFEQFVSAGVALDSVDFDVESVVLAFDADLRLDHVSRGYLWDLVPSAQQSSSARRLIRNTPR